MESPRNPQSDVWDEKISGWVRRFLDNPKNLANEVELIEQARVAIRHFRDADSDKSSSLSLDELKRLCDRMGLPMEDDEEEALLKMDTDDSGALDIDEWALWWLGRVSFLPNPAKQQEAIARNTFAKFDKDSSGAIDAAELRGLISALGADFTDEEVVDAIAEMDQDNSGVIEVSEFVYWWTNRSLASRNQSTSLVSLKLRKLAAKAAQVFHTDIFTASWNGDDALVKSFLESEPRLAEASDESDYGESWTALMYACYRGHQSIVQLLLDHKASVNATNRLGFTALFYAAQRGHLAICSQLMEKGADPTLFGSHDEDEGLFLSPFDHVADYKELRVILQGHPKCKPPQTLTANQMEISILNPHSLGNYNVTITVQAAQRTLSLVPLQYYKVLVTIDPMENPEVAAAFETEEFPTCEILLPAPNPAKQPQIASGQLSTPFVKFIRYFAYLRRIHLCELRGTRKSHLWALWEEVWQLYNAIDPVYRRKISLEQMFLASLDRGVIDAGAVVMRTLFHNFLAQYGGKTDVESSAANGADANGVTLLALTPEQLEEVVKNFVGVDDAHAAMSKTPSAATATASMQKKSSQANSSSNNIASSSNIAPSKVPSTTSLRNSAQQDKGAQDKKGSDSKGDTTRRNSHSSTSVTPPTAGIRPPSTALSVTQVVSVQVALVNSIFSGEYSEAVEVTMKL